jgi:uncharacterized protein (DUF697 family)
MTVGYEFEAESGWNPEFEYEGDFEFGTDGPFDETVEMELAAELLTVVDEQDLDEFIGRAIRRAGRALRSPVGRAVGGALRNVARTTLPFVAGAAGTALGGPVGGAIGSAVGRAASQAFELELEGLTEEDGEFELARRFVRLSGETVRQAADMSGSNAAPETIARQALQTAARRWAPGLVRPQGELQTTNGERSGRWVRRGRNIVLIGA